MNEKQQTTLAVAGMTCPSCIRHVTVALKDLDGVEGVEVKLREGRVQVVHEASVAVKAMVEALREAGYESRAA